MRARIPVSFSDSIALDLKHLHDTVGLKWREIATMPEYKPIPPGTLCAIANGYPIPKRWRVRLGLPPIKQVKACPCGEVHTSKSCPNEPRRYTKQHRPRIHPTDEEWEYIKSLSADEKLRRLLTTPPPPPDGEEVGDTD